MNKITILGSQSGRNAGDSAVLEGVMSAISELVPDIEFEVLTLNPAYIKNAHSNFNVKPISEMPWNLSIRKLGLPAFRSINRTDITIITGGLLFDKNLYNPLFNVLPSFCFLITYAKKIGKPVILYNVSVGPVKTKLGKKMVRFLADQVDLITTRDEESLCLLRDLGVTKPRMLVFADAALNNKPSEKNRIKEILQDENIAQNRCVIGFNINTYIDSWIRNRNNRLKKQEFQLVIAEVADRLVEELSVEIVFFATQVTDIKIIEQTVNMMKKQKYTKIITNKKYSHSELTGLLKEVDLLFGMRMHSLVLAASMGTPVVALVYSPKVRYFMRQINQEKFAIDFSDFDAQMIYSTIETCWTSRESVKQELKPKINELQIKARQTAKLVTDFL